MRKTEIGVKVYETGDKVTIRTGKVLYTVKDINDRGELIVESDNTGRTKVIDTPADLNLAQDVRTTDWWKAKNAEQAAAPEHIPGESPAAYKRRTGLKLDGRTTVYGRMILVGLQLKRNIFGGTGAGRTTKHTTKVRSGKR